MARKQQAGQGGTQTGLPGLDWKRCRCGCGTQFLTKGKGRHRQYFDDTHKTRAYRLRKKEQEVHDMESEQMWRGYLDSLIEEYAECDPDASVTWWAQYELMRRNRATHKTTPSL